MGLSLPVRRRPAVVTQGQIKDVAKIVAEQAKEKLEKKKSILSKFGPVRAIIEGVIAISDLLGEVRLSRDRSSPDSAERARLVGPPCCESGSDGTRICL